MYLTLFNSYLLNANFFLTSVKCLEQAEVEKIYSRQVAYQAFYILKFTNVLFSSAQRTYCARNFK